MKLLVSALFVILSFSAQAYNITCGGDADTHREFKDFGVAITDIVELPCNLAVKGERVYMQVSGVGPTLRGNFASGVVLSCPFTKDFNMDHFFMGFKAEMSCIVGVGCGLFFGKEGGFCTFVKGNAGGLGAAATINAIRFTTH